MHRSHVVRRAALRLDSTPASCAFPSAAFAVRSAPRLSLFLSTAGILAALSPGASAARVHRLLPASADELRRPPHPGGRPPRLARPARRAAEGGLHAAAFGAAAAQQLAPVPRLARQQQLAQPPQQQQLAQPRQLALSHRLAQPHAAGAAAVASATAAAPYFSPLAPDYRRASPAPSRRPLSPRA